MNSEKVLKLGATMLNIEEGVIGADSTDEKTRDLMMVALNNVISEIAEEYIPFLKSEKVVVSNGKLNYTAFEKSPRNIIKIKQGKKNVAFCRYVEHVSVNAEDGEVEVIYSYVPDKISFGEDIVIPPEISERTLAAGVAGEYALMSERYEECVNYDNKFMSGVKAAMRQKKERILPCRRWV